MISLGSLDEVVFMLQVKRRERGFTSALSFTTLLRKQKRLINNNVFVENGLYSRNNLKTGYFYTDRYKGGREKACLRKEKRRGGGEERRRHAATPQFLSLKNFWEFGKTRPYIPFDSMDILLSLSALLSLRDCEAGPVWWWWWPWP